MLQLQPDLQLQLQLHLQLRYTTLHPAVVVRWPLQPLQPVRKTQLQPPFGPSVDSPCHPWVTTTNPSYRFPMSETSATDGTTGIIVDYYPNIWFLYCMYIYIHMIYVYVNGHRIMDEEKHRCKRWISASSGMKVSKMDEVPAVTGRPSNHVPICSKLKRWIWFCFEGLLPPIWWRLFLTLVCKCMKGDQQDQPKTQRCPSPMENLQISGPARFCNPKIGWLTHGLLLKWPMKSADPLWSRLHAPNPCRSFSKCGQLPNHWNSHSMSISYFQNNH